MRLYMRYRASSVICPSCCAGSYGSLAMFSNLRRMVKVTDSCLMGGSGDYSDFQQVRVWPSSIPRSTSHVWLWVCVDGGCWIVMEGVRQRGASVVEGRTGMLRNAQP